ncbi:MAG TPA: hypothetical protein VGN63_22970 [Flavisolibacter sp.]|jgi:hypothetical protein|nr:hypothetical protein [Flavisolibacter sp.]
MDEQFELPVLYKGEEVHFPAQLQQSGYTHRFVVDVYGTEVFFEPDEERSYRALIDPENTEKQLPLDLLQAIAEGIALVLK